MQGALAFVMHCADVVVAFLNDEVSWQHAFARYAENPGDFVPRKYRLRWRSIVLFIAKSCLQWVFGYAVGIDIKFMVSFVPLTVVTVIILLLAIMLESMVRHKPQKGGPTTYGEFHLLFIYISRYHFIWL
jgi:hypothetical protein